MIKRIIFLLGDLSSQYIQAFCTQNRDALARQGFLYPKPFSSSAFFDAPLSFERSSPGCDQHDTLYNIFRDVDPKVMGESFHGRFDMYKAEYFKWLRSFSQQYRTGGDYTLCLAWPKYWYRPVWKAELSFLARLFPGAQSACFLVLSEHNLSLEAYVSSIILGGSPSGFFASKFLGRLLDYGARRQQLLSAVPQAESAIVLSSGAGKDQNQILDAFQAFAGISVQDDLRKPQDENITVHPDVLAFALAVNRAVYASREWRGMVPLDWLGQRAFIASGKAPSAWLDSGRQMEIYLRHKDANDEFAASLGVENPFEPPLSRDEDAFAGLTEEQVHHLAKHLTPDFRDAAREIIEAIPEVRRQYDLRLIYQALRDLNAPAGPSILPGKQPAKVAVLTTTFNHARYIEDNIRGVLAQKTDFPIEHIIADDGSTDGTQDIILEYAAKHPHITPLFRSRRDADWEGQTIPRAFSMARTPYVALCEGDDYFCNPHKLQRQVDFLDKNKRHTICFHPVHMVWENKAKEDRPFPRGKEFPPHAQPYFLADLIRWNFMSTPSVMYRWRFSKGVPAWLQTGVLPGDWFWHMLHAETGRIGMLDEVMSVYRRHDGGVWKYAETDLVKHKKKHSTKELNTYIQMDAHFKGRFRDLFSKRILWEFSMLYEMSVVHNEPGPFEKAVHDFPEWAGEVRDMLAAQSQSVEAPPE